MPIIELETFIKAPIGRVFDLSRSIDLHKISTSKTQEEAIAGRTTGLIELGETVTWRAKHLGVVQTLTSKITSFDFPNHFADEQVEGAFKSFKHDHFYTQKDGGTHVMDRFVYKSPFGWIGKLVDQLFLKRYMTEFLEIRNQTIKEFAETDQWKGILKDK